MSDSTHNGQPNRPEDQPNHTIETWVEETAHIAGLLMHEVGMAPDTVIEASDTAPGQEAAANRIAGWKVGNHVDALDQTENTHGEVLLLGPDGNIYLCVGDGDFRALGTGEATARLRLAGLTVTQLTGTVATPREALPDWSSNEYVHNALVQAFNHRMELFGEPVRMETDAPESVGQEIPEARRSSQEELGFRSDLVDQGKFAAMKLEELEIPADTEMFIMLAEGNGRQSVADGWTVDLHTRPMRGGGQLEIRVVLDRSGKLKVGVGARPKQSPLERDEYGRRLFIASAYGELGLLTHMHF